MIHTFVVLAYKESKYLEECINSCLNQTVKTSVVIATSTPNDYIDKIAKKYKLKVYINKSDKKGIGYDFDFARTCVDTKLVTIAHQDDLYDETYAEEVINAYKKENKSIIIFPDYYEIRKEGKVYKNTNLKIKSFLLRKLRNGKKANKTKVKQKALRYGNSICCPAVSFVTDNITGPVFESDMKSNIDWLAWYRLSLLDGYFNYIHKPLMGHRIYDESTTSKVINESGRSKEDYEMFIKFWPKIIAKGLTKFYQMSEKSNKN